jgi:hypothetical protein
MRTWILTIFALAIPASGCTRNAATFYEEMVRLGCRYQKKCDKAWFNANFDDMADCRDDMTDMCSPEDFEDACKDYDEGAAKDCLDQTRKQIRECEEDDNDDDCELDKVCGDDPETLTAILECFGGGGGGDGWGGDGPPPPPDQTGG